MPSFRFLCGLFWIALLPHVSACQTPAAEPEVAVRPLPDEIADTTFARLVTELSGPGGYFDTDNLISNETSYLHVLGPMHELGVSGGAYLGVGPDQNYSYLAQIRPEVAFMIDIRSDNVLQHLLFKALFAEARTRLEYLSLLFARPLPDDLDTWTDRDLETLVAYIDDTSASESRTREVQAVVQSHLDTFELSLSDEDRAKIAAFHGAFIDAGPGLRFNSHYRSPQPYYPTYRQLLLETDRTGRQGNYLAREEDFRFLKQMHAANRIIPIVGDLAGPHAVRAVGAYLETHGLAVSAFYTSNVEYYLMADRTFDRFAENVKALPRTDTSVIIRSYFNRYRSSHPQTLPGYGSTQLLQTMNDFVEAYDSGAYGSYWTLLNDYVEG